MEEQTSFTSFLKFITSVLIYMMFLILRVIFSFINAIYSRIFFRNSDKEHESVVRGRVLWRRKWYEFTSSSERDYLCLYTSLVSPEYVLKPNVSLYSVNKQEAIFIETDEHINIYSSDVNPFLCFAQFEHSKYVMRMPTYSFHSLAQKIVTPDIPVVWVSQTGRCGSTLLCQILESIPGTLLISEPDAPSNIELMQQIKTISEEERDLFLVSTIKLFCKPCPGTKMICIKTKNHCVSLMKHLSRLFPTMKQIFIYRNCKETVSSLMALQTATLFTKVSKVLIDSEWFTALKPLFKEQSEIIFIRKTPNSEAIHAINKVTNSVGLFTYMWANYMFVAQDAMSKDKNILAVKYEDLVSEKVVTCRHIFEKLGIDLKHLTTALTAFSQDSQRGSILSISRIGKTSARLITNQEMIEADFILSCYSLPRMGEDFRLLPK